MWSVWCTNNPVVSYQDEEEVREEVFHQQLAVYMSKEYIHLLGMWLPSTAVTYTVALTHRGGMFGLTRWLCGQASSAP